MSKKEEVKTEKIMNPVDPELIDILNQLHINKMLYENALGKISDTVTKEKIERLLAKKNVFIKEIARVFNIDINTFLGKYSTNIEMKYQKVINQFDDLFLKEDDQELMAFIISTEKKLQKIYQSQTVKSKCDDFQLMILENQLSESRRDMVELNQLQNTFS